MCPGCPYVINFISNVIADDATRSSDCGQCEAVACSPFSPKRTVGREQHHSCRATRKMITSVGCFRVIGVWGIFPAMLRELSFRLWCTEPTWYSVAEGMVCFVLLKILFFRSSHNSERLVKCVCLKEIRNPFRKPFVFVFYILKPTPCYTYVASWEDG